MKRIITYIMCATLIFSGSHLHAGIGSQFISLWNTMRQLQVRSTVSTVVETAFNAIKSHTYIPAACTTVLVVAVVLQAKKQGIKVQLQKAHNEDYAPKEKKEQSLLGQKVRRLYKIKPTETDTQLLDALSEYEDAYKIDDKEGLRTSAATISEQLNKRSIIKLLLTK